MWCCGKALLRTSLHYDWPAILDIISNACKSASLFHKTCNVDHIQTDILLLLASKSRKRLITVLITIVKGIHHHHLGIPSHTGKKTGEFGSPVWNEHEPSSILRSMKSNDAGSSSFLQWAASAPASWLICYCGTYISFLPWFFLGESGLTVTEECPNTWFMASQVAPYDVWNTIEQKLQRLRRPVGT